MTATLLNQYVLEYFKLHTTKVATRKSIKKKASEVTPTVDPLQPIIKVIKNAPRAEHSQLIKIIIDIMTRLLRIAHKKHAGILINRTIKLSIALFSRSAIFRKLMVEQLHSFYNLILNRVCQLSGVPAVSMLVKLMTSSVRMKMPPELQTFLAMVEKWKDQFGTRHPQLIVGYQNLVDQAFIFPNSMERELLRQKQNAHDRRYLEAKLAQVERELEELLPEMRLVIDQMNSVFVILLPNITETSCNDTDEITPLLKKGNSIAPLLKDVTHTLEGSDDPEIVWEDVDAEKEITSTGTLDMNDMVQEYGLGSSDYHLSISINTGKLVEKNKENAILFGLLEDGIRQTLKRFLPTVESWTSVIEQAAHRELYISDLDTINQTKQEFDQIILKWRDLATENERKRNIL
ncbi:unnamed protein product [Albugo candida]|uniref:VHS domain-containing protein n=1 Tax=Albugo candida TaxID=65357 RepID=A0A024GRV3_9STRA|nr:unnamed protein product [Albugo candida]|eukprot:CCI49421.1 unnamed protein product [Albugo candida]